MDLRSVTVGGLGPTAQSRNGGSKRAVVSCSLETFYERSLRSRDKSTASSL